MARAYNYNKYGDNLARKRRRRFFIKLSAIITSSLLIIAGIFYFVFFSSVLKLKNTEISGLESVKQEEINSIVDYLRDHRILGRIGLMPYANILFFDTGILKEKISSKFTEIKETEISKDFPDTLVIDITERHPYGTWCITGAEKCRYFDEEGVLWGEAVRSLGSLLITIDDNRPGDSPSRIETNLIKSIEKSVSELSTAGIKTRRIEIPEEWIGDFKIHTAQGFYIYLNIDSDIPKQIQALKILLNNKDDGFRPEYIDLRINERIYYK